MDYLKERINYGGVLTPRGEVIQDLQIIAASITPDKKRQQRLVDMYLIGAERAGTWT